MNLKQCQTPTLTFNWNFIRLSVVLMARPGQDEGGLGGVEDWMLQDRMIRSSSLPVRSRRPHRI